MEDFLTDENVLFSLLKFAVILSGIFYIIFALVIVKQVNKMTETLEVGFEAPLRFFSLAHLLLAIGALVISLLIL